ncbi:MAG: phage terminase large subunit [Flavobacteriales bacterium]|jgi:hypothetical protein|nr:phage terminase large subunit [Flavobacteriales bacterium]
MRIDFANYYQPKPKQASAHSCRAKYLLFGGAMGGGKSWFLCAEAIKNAMMFNGNRLVILRKELSVARRTILVTFFSICPPEIIKSYNQSSLTITFVNGSILTFMEANISKDPLLNKIKGLEIGWAGIDEANEISKEVYQILKTRLRWVLPDGNKPRYEIRLTSNPENCWLIPTFIQSTNEDEVYIQSLTSDNYSKDSDYYKNLEEAFKDNPIMLKKYLEGDWSMIDSINQLIPNEYISNCQIQKRQNDYRSIGIDPARFGDDRTVFVVIFDGDVRKIETYQKTSISEIVTKAIELMSYYGINPENVGVDGVGIGAGVIDELASKGYRVKELIGGAKPEEVNFPDSFQPSNLRSQMFYQLRQDMKEGNIGNIQDQTLKLELGSITYEIAGDKTVKVANKDVIRKMLGSSPDIADALVYANWVKETRSGLPEGYLPAISGSINIREINGW